MMEHLQKLGSGSLEGTTTWSGTDEAGTERQEEQEPGTVLHQSNVWMTPVKVAFLRKVYGVKIEKDAEIFRIMHPFLDYTI